MAATGVLPFIRGVDLSGNDFKVRPLGSILRILLIYTAFSVGCLQLFGVGDSAECVASSTTTLAERY